MLRVLASLFALTLFAASPALAAEATPSATASTSLEASGNALIETDDDGLTIDWSRFVLRIKGIGMAPDRGSLAQRRLMAKRTAFADGYRRLAESLDQLRVNGSAFVRDLTAVDDQTRLGINELIRDARAVDTHYWADGSVEVTMELPLTGPASLARVVFGPTATASESIKTKPTGIVIDARGTGAQPALRARLRDQAGKPLTVEEAPVAYYHVPDGAKPFAGESPLSLKAKRAYGPTRADLLLGDDEANRVKDALKNGARLPIAIIL
ncbi:MAG TPA: hypothetical protein V6D05_09130 [Stenomitos sp.]